MYKRVSVIINIYIYRVFSAYSLVLKLIIIARPILIQQFCPSSVFPSVCDVLLIYVTRRVCVASGRKTKK